MNIENNERALESGIHVDLDGRLTYGVSVSYTHLTLPTKRIV